MMKRTGKLKHESAAAVWRAAAAILLCGFSTLGAAAPNQSPFSFDAGVGFADYQAEIKPDCWYPVWAKVGSKDRPIRGTLIFVEEGNLIQVEIPIDLEKGTVKLYRSYFKFDQSNPNNLSPKVTARLEIEGAGSGEIPIPVRIAAPNTQLILAICEEPGGFSFLNQRERETENQALRSVIYGSVDYLPEDSVALDPLDAIIISGPQVREISAKQWEAIQGWIARGGRLMLAAGRHAPFIAQSHLKDLFGFHLGEAEPAPLGAIFNAPESEKSDRILATWPDRAEGTWQAAAAGNLGHPLIAAKQFGYGRFYLCAAALDTPLLARMGNLRDTIWPAMLTRPSPPADLQTVGREWEGFIGISLQSAFGILMVDSRWVFFYLIGYLALAMPLNWWLCKKIKRSEWSWGITIAVALSFAGYGYSKGRGQQQKNFQINELTLMSRAAPDVAPRATTFSTIFTPFRFSDELHGDTRVFVSNLKNPQAFNDPVRYYRRPSGAAGWFNPIPNPVGNSPSADLYSKQNLTLNFENSTSVKGFYLYPWSVRNFRSEYAPPIQKGVRTLVPVTIQSKDASEHLAGKIRNETPWSFKRCWIAGYYHWYEYNTELPAGAELDFEKLRALPAGLKLTQMVYDTVQSGFNRKDAVDSLATRALSAIQLPLPSGVWFYGESEDYISPLTADLKGTRVSRLIYEEQLPPGKTGTESGHPLIAGEWGLVRGEPGRTYTADPSVLLRADSTQGTLTIPAQSLMVCALPMFYTSLEADTALKVSFSLGSGVIGTTDAPSEDPKYRLIGCPVRFYNFARGAWDDPKMMAGEPIVLKPANDYLGMPQRFIAVYLSAEQQWLQFAPTDIAHPKGSNLLPYPEAASRGSIDLRFDFPRRGQAPNIIITNFRGEFVNGQE